MRFSPGAMVWTLFGWTPGLRQIVAGRVLDCGCLAGLYETWNGEFVEILDGPSDCCRHPHHNENFVLNGTVTAGKRRESLRSRLFAALALRAYFGESHVREPPD
jgi:hypothetical protein